VARCTTSLSVAQRRKPAKSLEYYAQKYCDRNDAIERAYRSGGYTLKAVGDPFGLHYSRVSRIVTALEKAKGKT